MNIGHVLVIRPGALGDSVLTLPALSALHRAGAESLMVLGTPASFGFINRTTSPIRIADFSSSGWLGLFADGAALSSSADAILKRTKTAVVYLSGETDAMARRLRGFGVERVLVVDPPKASADEPLRANTRHRVVERHWRELKPEHAARRLMDPLAAIVSLDFIEAALDPANVDRMGWLVSRDEEMETARRWLDLHEGYAPNFMAIHPGSGGKTKCWPAAHFAEFTTRIARERGCVPLVFFGPADEHTRHEFEAAMPRDVAWRAVAQRSLREALALLNLCGCFVGNDSGMAHLAARAVPVLSLFGPTDPERWAALGQNVRVIEAERGALAQLDVDFVFDACRHAWDGEESTSNNASFEP